MLSIAVARAIIQGTEAKAIRLVAAVSVGDDSFARWHCHCSGRGLAGRQRR